MKDVVEVPRDVLERWRVTAIDAAAAAIVTAGGHSTPPRELDQVDRLLTLEADLNGWATLRQWPVVPPEGEG